MQCIALYSNKCKANRATAHHRKARKMINYNITRNEEKTITRHDWMLDGYMLTIIKYEDRSSRISIAAPTGAPELHADDFREDPAVEVNWSALGSVSGDEARDYAAKIAEAADIADTFQCIIDGMK